MGLAGSNYCCLGFSCSCFIHLGGGVRLFHWMSRAPLHSWILLPFMSNCYLCFLHVHSVQVSFWGSSSAPLCSCFKTNKKLTVTLFITTKYLYCCGYHTVYFFLLASQLLIPFDLPEIVRLNYFFAFFFVPCKLPCKSHFIHNQDARL